jgi:hypothetical protein
LAMASMPQAMRAQQTPPPPENLVGRLWGHCRHLRGLWREHFADLNLTRYDGSGSLLTG